MLRQIGKILPAVVGSAVGRQSLGKGLVGAGVGMVAARIARKSVPGALIVGGAILAKAAYDRKQRAAVPADPPAEADQDLPVTK
jgi:uncharacterized protein (DUF697 family)